MHTYWPAIGKDTKRFQIEQYNKHMKYFHSHALFKETNMWHVGLNLGKMFLSINDEYYLNNIIFSHYNIGDVILCKDFVQLLRVVVGHHVKVTFWWPNDGGPGFLREILY